MPSPISRLSGPRREGQRSVCLYLYRVECVQTETLGPAEEAFLQAVALTETDITLRWVGLGVPGNRPLCGGDSVVPKSNRLDPPSTVAERAGEVPAVGAPVVPS